MACSTEPVLDIFPGLVFVEWPQVMTERYPLSKLSEFRLA
jgi:hypothetical protein